eukprot:gene25661-31378_t
METSDDFGAAATSGESDRVRIGDEILLSVHEPWLSTEDAFGFICATTDFRSCVVHSLQPEVKVPHSMMYTQFFIYPKMSHNVLKEIARHMPKPPSEIEILRALRSYDSADVPDLDHTDIRTEKVSNLTSTSLAVLDVRGTGRSSIEEDIQAAIKMCLPKFEEEYLANIMELKRISGQSLVFGDVVQLRHRLSGRYLTINQNAASLEEQDCMRMTLEDFGGRSSWFRILPGFRSKTQGEPVLYDDPVLFQSVDAAHNIHVASCGSQIRTCIQPSRRILQRRATMSLMRKSESPWEGITL